MIGVAVAGIDHWYNLLPLLEQLRESRDFKVVAICDPDEARAAPLAAAQEAWWTPDLAPVLADDRVDLVAVFSSTDRAADLACAAAAQGKHVLANKPIAMNPAEADAVVEHVQQAGTHYFSYESYARLTPVFLAMRSWLDEGRLGTLTAIRCVHEAAVPVEWEGSSRPGWWTSSARTPGGGWIDHAIYQLDLIRWLSGAEIRGSAGVTGTFRHTAFNVEDYGTATFSLSTGAVATSEAHWLAPPGAFRRLVELTGTEGTMIFDSTADSIRMFGRYGTASKGGDVQAVILDRERWSETPVPQGSGPVLLDHIAQVLRGDAAPVASVLDGKVNLEACLQFYQSATSLT